MVNIVGIGGQHPSEQVVNMRRNIQAPDQSQMVRQSRMQTQTLSNADQIHAPESGVKHGHFFWQNWMMGLTFRHKPGHFCLMRDDEVWMRDQCILRPPISLVVIICINTNESG